MARRNYVIDQDETSLVTDMASIGKVATTEAERRRALDACLNRHWADREIGRVDREEAGEGSGWRLYPYRE